MKTSAWDDLMNHTSHTHQNQIYDQLLSALDNKMLSKHLLPHLTFVFLFSFVCFRFRIISLGSRKKETLLGSTAVYGENFLSSTTKTTFSRMWEGSLNKISQSRNEHLRDFAIVSCKCFPCLSNEKFNYCTAIFVLFYFYRLVVSPTLTYEYCISPLLT